MKLPSKVKFFDEKTKFAFEELKHSTTEDKQLFKFLNQAFENLEEDAFSGDPKFQRSRFRKSSSKSTGLTTAGNTTFQALGGFFTLFREARFLS